MFSVMFFEWALTWKIDICQMFLFQLKLPQIQAIMREFEKQSEIMDMKEEMMSDAIDDAMGDEEDEEERSNISIIL